MAAGPGGTEVGRVSVRVVPKTQDFRKDLREDLERETKGLEAEIDVTFDSAGLRQRLQAIVTQASRGVDAQVGIDFDQAELRRIQTQLAKSFQQSGGARGGNAFSRMFSSLFQSVRLLIPQTKTLFTGIQTGAKKSTQSVDVMGRSLKVSADTATRIRKAFEEYNKAVGDSSDGLKKVNRDIKEVVQTSDNLPVLWSEANKSMQEIAKTIRDAADRQNELLVGPKLDMSAMAKFRQDLRKALETARKEVDTRKYFEVGPDGIREITTFEHAVRRAGIQIRDIATRLNQITQATARLRFAWNGLVSTVKGVPGWIVRIGTTIADVRGNWDRFNVAVNRTGIEIDDLAQKILGVGDSLQRGFIRAWLELDNAASGALSRIGSGIDRVLVSVNRLNIEAQNGAQNLSNAWASVGRAAESLAARFYDLRLTTIDLPGRWHDVRAAILNSADAVVAFGERVRDISGLWYDIRRASLQAGDGIANMGRRLIDVRAHMERVRSAIDAIRNGFSRIDWNAPYRGFIRAGDQGVRFGQVIRNVARGSVEAFKALGTLGKSVWDGITTGMSAAASAIRDGVGGAIRTVGSMLQSLGEGAKNRVEALQKIAQTIGQIALVALQLGAVSGLLATLGAAVTGAWGAASTAIAAIPGALLFLAGPIAAITTGLDGIKAAAKTIQPEFDKLKASVSSTFEKGLTPVFRTLADDVFPSLQTGLNLIAESVVGVADDLVRLVATESNLKLLDQTFRNIAVAVDGLSPALQDIVAVMLEMGAMEGVFTALVSAVQTFASEWRNAITELNSNGTLAQAFEGLDLLLDSLARAFAGLVKNGIEVFAGAAPGMADGFDSITKFFDRFDWETLGTAVGDVFRGIGESIDQIDQGTIDSITDAFVRLGDTFRDPAYQSMFAGIVDAIPYVIDSMNQLIQIFIRIVTFIRGVGTAVSGLASILSGTAQTIVLSMKAISDPIAALNGDFKKAFEDAGAEIAAGAGKITEGLGLVGDAFSASGPVIGAQAYDAASQWGPRIGAGIANGMSQADIDARYAATGLGSAFIEPLEKVPADATSALSPLPDAVGAIANALPGVVQEGLSPIPDTAIGIFEQLSPGIRRAFGGLSITAYEGMGYIRQSVFDGLTEIKDLFALKLGAELGTAVTTAFTGLSTIVTTAMTEMVTAVTTAATTMSTSFTTIGTSVSLLGESFRQGATAGTTFTANLNTVNASLVTMTEGLTAANAALVLVNTSLTTVGTSLVTVITGITDLVTGVNALKLSMDLLDTILTTLNISFPTLTTSLGLFNTILTTLNITTTTFSTRMTEIGTAVTTLVPLITQLVEQFDLLATTFTTLSTTVTTAMTAIVTSVTEGLVQINTAWAEGVALWVELITTGMAAVVDAIATGMGDAVNSVQTGIDLMVSALRSAVADFRDAGAAMGQGLVEGLNSKLGAVRAAAARLANAAAAAVRAAAAIASPSKVFARLGAYLGEGLAVGMDDSRRDVRASARGLVDEVVSASQSLQDAFNTDGWSEGLTDGIPKAVKAISQANTGSWNTEVSSDGFGGIGEAVETALSGWGVQIDSNGLAKLVNKSNTRKARRA